MKCIVEFDDFYLDDENDLSAALKDHVVGEVIQKIWARIEKKVETSITAAVREEIDNTVHRKVLDIVEEIAKKQLVDTDGYDKTQISLEQRILKSFSGNRALDNPTEYINKLSDRFAVEFKERYDMQFAAKIVDKMAQNGLLKDGAIDLLLK